MIVRICSSHVSWEIERSVLQIWVMKGCCGASVSLLGSNHRSGTLQVKYVFLVPGCGVFPLQDQESIFVKSNLEKSERKVKAIKWCGCNFYSRFLSAQCSAQDQGSISLLQSASGQGQGQGQLLDVSHAQELLRHFCLLLQLSLSRVTRRRLGKLRKGECFICIFPRYRK